jgi:uncharacterized protein (DUF111 family)
VNKNKAAQRLRNQQLFTELRVEMDSAVHGDSSIIFRAEGNSAESVSLAPTKCSVDCDETATALSLAVIEGERLVTDIHGKTPVDECAHVEFNPPLADHIQVEVESPYGIETVTLKVTTPTLRSIIGALFLNFTGTVSHIREILTGSNDGSSGVVVTTNIT